MNRFVIADPGQCIGCNTCMAACTQVHKEHGLQSLPRLTVTRTEAGTAPILCHHCEDAPCARVCPVAAITHGATSIDLDEKTCIGCKMCALACPFGAITPSGTSIAGIAGIRTATPSYPASLSPILAWEIGVRSVAVKCDLCAFSDQGPACVNVCPTHALSIVDKADMAQLNAVKHGLAVRGLALDPPFAAREEQETP